MKGCWVVAIVIVVCGTLLVGLFVVLLAMPKSRLRSVFMEVVAWVVAAASVVLLFSPLDLAPDVIPVVGQIDDIGYIISAVAGSLLAYRQRRQRDLLPPSD